ncbi:thermonuclease family protein [Methylobacterium sp. Leaf108]|uniref:thermonuclease family protein n=1 Tax=Methylobacterium sp. Leaf108 TaxID=1736256 RepID=UPI0009E86DBF|nr:thermonuclease family protein [Methylobacterium sp. Leaf108]
MRTLPLLALLLLTTPALAEPIVGQASVIDGDTFEVRGTRIRLHGIDAPESGQRCKDAAGKDYRCGQVAALALADRIGKRVLTCDPRDTDRYGRVVAVCRIGSEDLNAWMACEGHNRRPHRS